MNRLSELRAKIDGLNKELVALIQARGEIVMEIAEYKRTHELQAYDAQREKQMLQLLEQDPTGPFGSEAIHEIFQEILRASRALHFVADQKGSPQENTAS